MIFHYAGKYNGDENSLPYKEHHPNAIPFKEPKDMKKYSLIANLGCVLIMIVLVIPFLLMGIKYIPNSKIQMVAGGICGGLSMFPHELLHAVCFKKDVYMYNDLIHGLMFVVGTEDMSKARFIFMCLCPNLILGIIPLYFILDISTTCWGRLIWNYLHWNGVWRLLKYLQFNKADAKKFQNIFMWNAFLLVYVGICSFQLIEHIIHKYNNLES